MVDPTKKDSYSRALLGIIGGLLSFISVFIGWGTGTLFLSDTKTTTPDVAHLPIEFSYLYILFLNGLISFILYSIIYLSPGTIKKTNNLLRLLSSINMLALIFSIFGIIHIMMKYSGAGVGPGCPTAIVGSILGILASIKHGPVADIFQPREEPSRIEEDSLKYKGVDYKPVELEDRTVYLVKEEKPRYSFVLFSYYIFTKGRKGVCISRMHPSKIKERHKFVDVPMFWLSKASEVGDGINIINPVNIGVILKEIQNFLKINENGIILLDGLEYLIVQHEFPRILRLLHEINDAVMSSKGILILPFNILAVHEEERALLKRDMQVIVPGGEEWQE